MLDVLSPLSLLDFELPIRALRPAPRINGHVQKWKEPYRAPALCEINGQTPFADVYWAWNEHGFYLAVDVPKRTRRFSCPPEKWWSGDGLRICLATRETRDIRRATRFCHFFYVLPAGGGRDGQSPVVGLHRMSRAKEVPPVDASRIEVARHRSTRGYSLEVGIPAACLHGWDPLEHPRIAVFIKVKDVEHGNQNLAAPDNLGWNADPSQWSTAVLTE